ncbi:MAG: glutaredoxin [Verrucomicrobiia bacterium]|jgi:monothiol glutaredoxin
MNQLQIIAWLKPSCGWSNGVRAVLRKYDLSFDDRDVMNNPANYEEMVARSGQPLQPTLEIDGQILADVSGEEVEAWLIQKGYVQPSSASTDVPTNQACQDHPAPASNVTVNVANPTVQRSGRKVR